LDCSKSCSSSKQCDGDRNGVERLPRDQLKSTLLLRCKQIFEIWWLGKNSKGEELKFAEEKMLPVGPIMRGFNLNFDWMVESPVAVLGAQASHREACRI